MADDKNFAKIELKEANFGKQEIKNDQDRLRVAEKGPAFEGAQKSSNEVSGPIDEVKTEGEFGRVQPIGGFVVSQNTKRGKEIEDVLSHDLKDIYLQMPLNKQAEFKMKGEETAREINSLLDMAKIEVGKIIGLIRKWLQIIPGINAFFIEQEAKIKADEIIRLKKN